MFSEALQKLTTAGNTRANALLGLSVVEWTSSRHDEALKILTENAPLFGKITNHTLKGYYHNQLALVFRSLATNETKSDYFLRAVKEYEEADREFKLARNTVYRAHVKNNLGFLLSKLSRFRKAHEYLEHARRLTINVRDRVRTAQVDETCAQVFIAEHKYSQAEVVSHTAARSFEKAGRQCFLAEALTTHGIASARLGKTVRAQFAFRKAIEVASQAGSLNRAGLAALTMIEELDDLPPELLSGAYEQAGEWLSDSQSQEVWHRFRVAGKKLALKLRDEAKGEVATEILIDKPQNLKRDLLQVEREMIRTALTKANGSLTRAAKLLDMSYQALGYLIQSRHPELLKERTPIRRRKKPGGEVLS
jgi:tetratricopeptide (TPR) repeat protein